MTKIATDPGSASCDAAILLGAQHVVETVERAIDSRCEQGERTERREQMLMAQSAAKAAARQARRRQRL